MISAEITSTLKELQELDLSKALAFVGDYMKQQAQGRLAARQHPRPPLFPPTGRLSGGITFTVGDDFVTIQTAEGLPYAHVQNFSGATFIKATPIQVDRISKSGKISKIQTYKMARFFWAKFFETGNQAFKALALYVNKTGGVTVQGQPFLFFSPEDMEFIKSILQRYIVQFIQGN